MNRSSRPRAAVLAAALALPIATPALADDAALQRCRQVSEAGARLACYDAIRIGAPAAAAAAAATPAGPTPATAAPARAADSFGIERRPAAEVDAIESTVAGEFTGWRPNDRIKFANGQVWQVVDDSNGALGVRRDLKVRVRRGLFGAFFLEFEGVNASPRVRRVQ